MPVFLCDDGIDLTLNDYAAQLGMAGVMVDTAAKSRGSLLSHAEVHALAGLVAIAIRHGCLSGIAGSLRLEDAALLQQLAPDFAGFRGALCTGNRQGRFDAAKLVELRRALANPTRVERALSSGA